ncbi:RNA polymerase sigma-70 factor, ECF subfamily [Rhizobium sp. RU20A]|uniref:sigma-70 family RNA polymerase sigma factor n=1 Tax=Rhizobium sp. RU20A TaxID=1907412 RepID=UPI0009548BE6|nr:sigma-70 family RNA polymerase sigma factor [Rhizobium sp. RU20A]SIQ10915.1 RNA polymerase sigma-70 factor, ECF subfamily [Rhizobium sp. RU20A]
MTRHARDEEWESWLRAALNGDAAAYDRFLRAVTPHLRALARRRVAAFGAAPAEAEDLVQEVLLAIHLKRTSWDPARPLRPWLGAIVRNKLIDSLRRRGRHAAVPIEDVMEMLAAETDAREDDRRDAAQLLQQLKEPQRSIVRAISLDGVPVRETAERLKMSEGAVRVALHRALKTLAALYGSTER